jgi:hypothetical protein
MLNTMSDISLADCAWHFLVGSQRPAVPDASTARAMALKAILEIEPDHPLEMACRHRKKARDLSIDVPQLHCGGLSKILGDPVWKFR